MRPGIAKLLNVKYPVVLGPMRLITLGKMAADISNAGGFGIVAASGLSNDRLRNELEIAGKYTEKPFGVNIPVYRPNAYDALEISIDAGVKTIYTSAGNPSKLMGRIKEAGLNVIHKVSSVKTAKKAEEAGADAIVAMGFEAGGHVGREKITTFCLIPKLADILNIPVIAAGGIADARSLVAAFALGAEGVEIGTRFVATEECPVPDFFKQRIKDADLDDTLLIGKDTMPIRVLKNRVTANMAGLDDKIPDEEGATSKTACYVQTGGDMDSAVMPCGQVAGQIEHVEKISKILDAMFKKAGFVSQRLEKLF